MITLISIWLHGTTCIPPHYCHSTTALTPQSYHNAVVRYPLRLRYHGEGVFARSSWSESSLLLRF